jgi:P-type E1-E2 ATPase
MMNPDLFIGLTTEQAKENLAKYGPNAIQEFKRHPLLEFLVKFWSPIPWMLEITFILQLSLGKHTEAIVTICLLIFNGLIGFIQEKRAQSALSLLKNKLQIKTRVLRNRVWVLIEAQEIVKEDLIRVRMGDFIPADIKLLEGNILVDQSAVTGESLPVELTANQTAFSGTIVKRGEATGIVIATGKRSFFRKTAELVRSAKSESHFEKVVLNIVKYLISIDILLVSIILIYASIAGIPLSVILPFSLVLLIASIPVALPATFTLMSALASLKLADNGILVTKLTAIEDAAAMEILFSDKTGTLTENTLTLKEIRPLLPMSKTELLKLAAYASNEASQDPFDMAILSSASKEGVLDLSHRSKFIPFDSMTKRSEAIVNDQGKVIRVVKGAPALIASMVIGEVDSINIANQLAAQENRVLSIAFGEEDNQLQLAGLIIFSDPIRPESKQTIEDLRQLGLTVKMVTGDAAASMILTQPGLTNLIEAVTTGRVVYRRMLTYTLNKIVKTISIALFLSLGFLFENVLVITPRLVMFLIFANDFITMSLASDTVKIPKKPCRLRIRFLAPLSLLLGICWLGFYFGVFFIVRDLFGFPLPAIQTLMFLTFVFTGLATVYLVRTRDHLWKLPPGKFLLISTVGDVVAVSALAYFGILMEPLSAEIIISLAGCVTLFTLLLDQFKAFVFNTKSTERFGKTFFN